MEEYNMSSLSEVQRIIGLSLSKIQMGRNQRGGLPLHKNLLVATVLNKARDLYMQETMYMNYKMMTGQLGAAAAAQMTCVASNPQDVVPGGPEEEEDHPFQDSRRTYDEDSDVEEEEEEEEDEEEEEEEEEDEEEGNNNGLCPSSIHQGERYSPATSRSVKDEGFIDEPDCDCDARNFSSESTRVPFQYCYQCAPFHPSNGRGPTLVPASKPSITPSSEDHHRPSDVTESSTSLGGEPNNFTIYDMDSKATELRPSSHSIVRKRRISDSSCDSLCHPGKRNRTSESNTEPEYNHHFHRDNCEEVFHPAFRGNHAQSGGSQASPSMEIDQITSLVSIFSFGQQIMAAAAAASEANAAAAAAAAAANNSREEASSSPSSTQTSIQKTKINNKSEEVKKEEDSDSESDTSSDSGHSSDDHETSQDEKSSSIPPLTDQTCSIQENNYKPQVAKESNCILKVAATV